MIWGFASTIRLRTHGVECILYQKLYHLFLIGVGFTTNYGHFFIGKLCATIRNKVFMALKQLII
jgi:hypothetical protein